MAYELLSSGSSVSSSLRTACDPFDLPNNNSVNGISNFSNSNGNFGNNGNNGAGNFPFKPLALTYTPSPRPHLTMAEQAELEFELRYRGNMIVDQQRKIQQLEEELKRTRDQMDLMNNQIASYEQERMKERKKPQSRYWTPDEHQRFLEALSKYGHKDVKAISMHVSTRNATQVRTHAQKYFLRLERERRKKGDDDGREDGDSSGDDLYHSDQSLSPLEELSPQQPIQSVATPPQPMQQSSQNALARRRRSTSLITPSLGKSASQHRDSVLVELPSWTPEDYDQFVKGLLALVDKQQDLEQISKAIRDAYLPHLLVEDVEICYKLVHKFLKQKPATQPPSVSSPKRRRTSKPELPINMPLISEGPLPAMGSMSLSSSGPSSSPFTSFIGGMPNVSGGALPLPQYGNMSTAHNNSSVSLLPFQAPLGNGLMSMNMGNMRGMMDYGMPSMAPLQMNNNMGLSNMMGMMDISPNNVPPSSSQSQGWNSLAYSFDLHQSTSPSLSLPQGAPLVSSLN